MKDSDDKLLEEAYSEIQEGFWDQRAAKKAGKQGYKDAGGKTGLGGLAQKAGQAIGRKVGMQVSPEREAQAQAQQDAQAQGQVSQLANGYMDRIFGILDKLTKDMDDLGIKNIEQVKDERIKYWLKGILKLKADMKSQQTPEGGA